MAVTKTNTQVLNAVTMTAGAANVTTSGPAMNAAYGGNALVTLTNGGTGPTVPAQVQMQTSNDNSKWYNFGPAMVGSVTASAVTSWPIDIPMGYSYVRFVTGSNTGQNVTVDIDVNVVSAI